MKAFKILLLSLVVVLSSCSSSPDDTPVTDRTGNLPGTWKAIAYTIEGSQLTIENSDEATTVTFDGVGFEFTNTIFFGENPKSFSHQGNYKLDFFVTNENGQTSFSQGVIPVSDNGTYTFANNKITFMENGEEKVVTILELTANRLKYQIATNFDEVDGSTQTTTNMIEVWTFARIQ